MMHKAWCSMEEVPYHFSWSSIKFQGHTGRKIGYLDKKFSKITRPVAAIKSLRFALLLFGGLYQSKQQMVYQHLISLMYSQEQT